MDTRVAARFGTRAAQPPACRNRQWHREQARRRRDGRRWAGATAPDRAGDRRQALQVGMPRSGSGGRVSWPPRSEASSGPGSEGPRTRDRCREPQDRTLSPGRPNVRRTRSERFAGGLEILCLRSSRPARRTLPEDRVSGPVGGHPDPAQRRPIVRARARPRLINNPSAARRSSAAASSPSACLSAMARSAARLKGSSGAAALVKM